MTHNTDSNDHVLEQEPRHDDPETSVVSFDPSTVPDVLPLTAVVLAGGRSMRMGVDKTQVLLGDKPLLVLSVESLYHLTEQALIVTNRPEAVPADMLPDDVEVLTDKIAYQGPLGGLSSALPHVHEDWVVTSAADMPWLTPALVKYLWTLREGYDVVIPVGASGPEPLLALYRVAAVAPVAEKVLKSGKRRLVAMFPELKVREVPVEELQQVDPGLLSFFNINTQRELDAARTYLQKRAKDPSAKIPASLTPGLLVAQKPQQIRVMSAADTGRKMPSERPITIYMNEIEIATVQATDDHLEDMAVGFLVSEGLLKKRDKFTGVDVDAKRGLVYIQTEEAVPDDLVYKTRYITSGCGKGITFSSLGHARGLAPVTQMIKVDPNDLYTWMQEMSVRSEEYRERGGVHACGLVIDGELLLVREDVGRHNAADKLLGNAWRESLPIERAIFLSTGRISYEMMVKAAKSRIPFVASRSAATDLAVEIAEELKITLAGYVRGGKIVIYANPDRVISDETGPGSDRDHEEREDARGA